jgi:hypothetical protein
MLGTDITLYGAAPAGSYSVTVDGQTYPNLSPVGDLLYSAVNLSEINSHNVSLTLQPAVNTSGLVFFYAVIFIPIDSE